jgi:hypothetical protein
MFNPRNMNKGSANKPPLMLHFQFGGSSDVFRYVMVERISAGLISSATRRKDGEPKEESMIAKSYLKGKEDDREPEAKSTGLQGMFRNRRRRKDSKPPIEEVQGT